MCNTPRNDKIIAIQVAAIILESINKFDSDCRSRISPRTCLAMLDLIARKVAQTVAACNIPRNDEIVARHIAATIRKSSAAACLAKG